MKKLIYTRPDGGVSIVTPVTKQQLQRSIGPLSKRKYEKYIKDTVIPDDAINVRQLDDKHIPLIREFRNAWVDTEPGEQIDIDITKAKDIQLEKLRKEVGKKLEDLDKTMVIALGKGEAVFPIETEKQLLRDATEPLKKLKTKGKVNDTKLLQQIKLLGHLKEDK